LVPVDFMTDDQVIGVFMPRVMMIGLIAPAVYYLAGGRSLFPARAEIV
jgi:hypothetical protein